MKYQRINSNRHRWPRRLIWTAVIVIVLFAVSAFAIRYIYTQNLQPVSSSQASQVVTVSEGASASQIAKQLKQAGLIRSTWAFQWYVSSKEVLSALQAGTYSLRPSQSIQQIVAQLTHGKVATDLVTIVPGQRIDQVRSTLIKDGFSAASVDDALNPANYPNNPALVDKPASASLEGYLYPDSFQRTSATNPQSIIEQSLQEMQTHLTPDIRAAFAKEGLSTYQGITLASVVEQEVAKSSDRAQVAQVFLKRLSVGMALGSDVTAYYGSILAGQSPSIHYDTPYNTLLHTGLPAGPVSNVSDSSLQAVAHPATTDWLYFVTGDDGTTHFSQTLQQHEQLTQQYCHKLCSE
jgi:UPF0755 protein